MAEVNFYLRNNKASGDTGLMMFFSYGGKRIKIGTIDKINPKYWDNENQRAKQTKTFLTHPEFNQRLKDLTNISLDTYRTYLNDNGQQKPLPDTIKRLIKAELVEKIEPEKVTKYNLISFAEHIVEEIKSGRKLTIKGKPLSTSIYKIFKTHATVLKAYQGTIRHTISFDDCTSAFYHDFISFLINTKNYSTNTVGKHIRTLKAILNDATYLGINSRIDYKRFAAMTESVDNIYLTPEELNTIYGLDLKNNKRLERVRDLFLVGCWTESL